MKDVINLFFPHVCEACKRFLGDNERVFCTICRHDLPVTNFHFNGDEQMKKMLYGRVKLENATALFHFSKKSIVQQLLHNLKYRGHQEIGKELGKWLGSELSTIEAYKTIDAVVPVPLHRKRLVKRGYNQVTKFGQEIAAALNKPYIDNVLARENPSKTQVFKDRLKRWSTADSLFALNNECFPKEHNHILLVDDIITTGATIEACANVLKVVEDLKISVATIAIAD